jgi:hypothetical protein
METTIKFKIAPTEHDEMHGVFMEIVQEQDGTVTTSGGNWLLLDEDMWLLLRKIILMGVSLVEGEKVTVDVVEEPAVQSLHGSAHYRIMTKPTHMLWNKFADLIAKL